ncbi:uncharacterized protein LOC109285218 [Alligator mississippiensis]|uniref:uncharacterized protein LOC109285218 n=1 Tax=Alligator mississippiensis TaxID=8496 RepID=UPI002877D1C7|nr:uncharacterized protein LOC109285218 [Alligator mississippiensis]
MQEASWSARTARMQTRAGSRLLAPFPSFLNGHLPGPRACTCYTQRPLRASQLPKCPCPHRKYRGSELELKSSVSVVKPARAASNLSSWVHISILWLALAIRHDLHEEEGVRLPAACGCQGPLKGGSCDRQSSSTVLSWCPCNPAPSLIALSLGRACGGCCLCTRLPSWTSLVPGLRTRMSFPLSLSLGTPFPSQVSLLLSQLPAFPLGSDLVHPNAVSVNSPTGSRRAPWGKIMARSRSYLVPVFSLSVSLLPFVWLSFPHSSLCPSPSPKSFLPTLLSASPSPSFPAVSVGSPRQGSLQQAGIADGTICSQAYGMHT